MWKTERNGENWFIGHMQRPNGNHRGIDEMIWLSPPNHFRVVERVSILGYD